MADVDLLIERAALMLAGVWFDARPRDRATNGFSPPTYKPDHKAMIRECCEQAMGEITADEFCRRVTDNARNRTLSIGDDGMRVTADRQELEAILTEILRQQDTRDSSRLIPTLSPP